MLVDLSVLVTKFASREALDNEKIVAFGHLGTHFDVMNKEFPLAFVRRKGIIFNVKGIFDREITAQDIDLTLVEPEMFIAFYSNFIEEIEYGSKEYFKNHPQLSDALIDQLLQKKISIIGVDFAGIRRGAEHTPKDQYCADRNVFVVENLNNLHAVIRNEKYKLCIMNTYPIKFTGLSGLPCRVVAEV